MTRVKNMFCRACSSQHQYPLTHNLPVQCIIEEDEEIHNRDKPCLQERKKVVTHRNSKIRKTQRPKHAVAVSTCCNAERLDRFVYFNKGYWNMSQTERNYREANQVVRNASDKRIAWKNSAITAAASERDSLLTNSGDDRLSFDLRQEQKQTRESNRSPADSQLDNNSNRLRVPSPGRRSGFYATSPSTDEGIGTDDHVADDPGLKSAAEKSISQKKERNIKERCNSIKSSPPDCGMKEKYLIYNGSSPFASSPALFRRSYQTLPHRGQTPPLSHIRKPSSLQEEVLCVQCHRNEERSGHPLNYSPKSVNYSSSEVHHVANANKQLLNKKKIRRQSSDQQSNRSPRRLRARYGSRNDWTSVTSCCELGQGEAQAQEGPVLLYSRLPGEVHSCEARLPTLIERRESEVVTKKGIPFSRIISKSVDETKSKDMMNNNLIASQTSEKSKRDKNSSKIPYTFVKRSSKNHENSENIDTDSSKNGIFDSKSSTNSILKQSSTTSENNAPGSQKKLSKDSSAALKPKPRTGSTRSSIGQALSTSVVATATGVVPDKKPVTPREKQRRLTERLMSVGPSDPQRVQGIFEDILCEMGPKRIEQYKNAFARFDKDSSGIISSKQLRTLLRTLGHNPSDTELRELVNQVDMDENGKIDFNEFIIMIGYFDKANNENEDLIDIFRVFDRKGRGCIDVKELRNIWNNFLINDIPLAMFEEMINVVDNDGNGEINRVELLELLSTR